MHALWLAEVQRVAFLISVPIRESWRQNRPMIGLTAMFLSWLMRNQPWPLWIATKAATVLILCTSAVKRWLLYRQESSWPPGITIIVDKNVSPTRKQGNHYCP